MKFQKYECPACHGKGSFWYEASCSCCDDYEYPCYCCNGKRRVTTLTLRREFFDTKEELLEYIEGLK